MLYLYPMDLTGCGNYRVLHPYRALPEELQSQVKIIEPGGSGGVEASIRNGKIVQVDIPDDCDAVVVQRPTSEMLVQTLGALKANGVRIILEADDDLEALVPEHPTYTLLKKLDGHDSIMPRLAAGIADTIIASTPALAERLQAAARPDADVMVLRNRIPEAELAHRRSFPEDGKHVLGWPGAVITHPGDLKELRASVSMLKMPFTIVGDEVPGYSPGFNIAEHRLHYTGKIEFEDWIPTLARELSVGVVPLREHAFNRSKSALKALELAAAGVPIVRSTLPEFERLGVGLPAAKPKQWKAQMQRLLEDPELWQSTADEGYRIASENTYEKHVDEWITAWGLGN